MYFVRIFEDKDTFWCACYPEHDGLDVLTVLFEQWSDTEYLIDFFTANIQDLNRPYWQGISIDTAVNLVKEEVAFLEDKLICIEYNEPGCTNVKVSDIFTPYSKYNFVINEAQKSFVKGKIDSIPKMLRLYGVQLDDGTIVITGGAIKLTSGLGRTHLLYEVEKLHFVYHELQAKGISNLNSLK